MNPCAEDAVARREKLRQFPEIKPVTLDAENFEIGPERTKRQKRCLRQHCINYSLRCFTAPDDSK